MEHVEHVEQVRNRGGGNMVSPPKKTRTYFFTLNNYTDEEVEQVNTYTSTGVWTKWSIQSEVGKAGTPHLQGVVMFKNPVGRNSMKELLPRAWFQATKSVRGSVGYCSKAGEDGHDGKHKWHNWPLPKARATKKGDDVVLIQPGTEDPLEGVELRPFQVEIMEILAQAPDKRTVNWYWEPTGGVGKTTLARHVCMKYPGQALYISGSAKNIKCAIMDMARDGTWPSIIIYAVPQSGAVSYRALEEIKDGIWFNEKYKPGMVMMKPPHLIVLANIEPQRWNMSEDRWNVVKIT